MKRQHQPGMRGSLREGALAPGPGKFLCCRGSGRWGLQRGACMCYSRTWLGSLLCRGLTPRGCMRTRGTRQWCGYSCTRGHRALGGSRSACISIIGRLLDDHGRDSCRLLEHRRKGSLHCQMVLSLKEALPPSCRTPSRGWAARAALRRCGTRLPVARILRSRR